MNVFQMYVNPLASFDTIVFLAISLSVLFIVQWITVRKFSDQTVWRRMFIALGLTQFLCLGMMITEKVLTESRYVLWWISGYRGWFLMSFFTGCIVIGHALYVALRSPDRASAGTAPSRHRALSLIGILLFSASALYAFAGSTDRHSVGGELNFNIQQYNLNDYFERVQQSILRPNFDRVLQEALSSGDPQRCNQLIGNENPIARGYGFDPFECVEEYIRQSNDSSACEVLEGDRWIRCVQHLPLYGSSLKFCKKFAREEVRAKCVFMTLTLAVPTATRVSPELYNEMTTKSCEEIFADLRTLPLVGTSMVSGETSTTWGESEQKCNYLQKNFYSRK